MAVEAPEAAQSPAQSMSSWMTGNAEVEAKLSANVKPPQTPAPAGQPATPPARPEKPAEAAAKVEPATKPEDADEDGEKWPRESKDWKALKEKHKQERESHKKEIEARDARIKTFEEQLSKIGDVNDTLSLKDKLAQTQKERDEFDKLIQLSKVESHPKFKAYFDGKINPRVDMAKKIVGADNAERMAELLKMPDSQYRDAQIREIVSGLEVYDQSRIGALINELDQITGERNAEIAKASENYKQMTEAEQAATKTKLETTKKQLERSFSERVAKATDPKDGLFIFQKQDGNVEWNKAVDARLEAAKSLMFGDNTPIERIAEAALYTSAFPEVLQWAVNTDKAHRETISNLEAQVKALSAANPGSLPAGKPQDAPNDGSTPAKALPAGSRPMEATKSWIDTIRQDWQGQQ